MSNKPIPAESTPAYTLLAEIYDEVMEDVDYETWTDYIEEIISHHHEYAEDLLELACGTGTMALSMEEFGYYHIVATDASAPMIEAAKKKGEAAGSDVKFKVMDFLEITLDQTFDVVYMVFDSLNYLHSEKDILKLHSEVKKVLNPGGLFIYDFTTPRNSRKAIKYLDKETKTIKNRYRYRRESRYDHSERIHTNLFEIEELANNSDHPVRSFTEEHHQRIYTYKEIAALIGKTEFNIVTAYDGFRLTPAHKKSLRITMVLQ